MLLMNSNTRSEGAGQGRSKNEMWATQSLTEKADVGHPPESRGAEGHSDQSSLGQMVR